MSTNTTQRNNGLDHFKKIQVTGAKPTLTFEGKSACWRVTDPLSGQSHIVVITAPSIDALTVVAARLDPSEPLDTNRIYDLVPVLRQHVIADDEL